MNVSDLMSRPRAADAPAIAHALFSLLRKMHFGTLELTTPDGEIHYFAGREAGPRADLRLSDWRVVKEMMRSAEIGMAEAWRDGRIGCSDLTRLLELCVVNRRALEEVFYGNALVAAFYRLAHFLRANTRRQARKNIHAHYDLGNDFYALWLDGTMTYSSALFAPARDYSLEAAQDAKYERILQEIDPRPGDTILELGCGWGGFAEYAARTRDVRITGITLSKAQLDFAVARIARAGLSDRVALQLVDYRDVAGQYDHIVSVEMFEAVGERFWPVYFRRVYDLLKPGGRAVIQAITIAEDAFERYRVTSDFIREYIFPGGMLAPVTRFVSEARAAGLTTDEPFMFGHDYAETLRLWRDRVNAAADRIRPLGFDEKFLQLWRFYLCYCEAGFRTGRTDVMQVRLHKAGT